LASYELGLRVLLFAAIGKKIHFKIQAVYTIFFKTYQQRIFQYKNPSENAAN